MRRHRSRRQPRRHAALTSHDHLLVRTSTKWEPIERRRTSYRSFLYQPSVLFFSQTKQNSARTEGIATRLSSQPCSDFQ